MRSLSLLLLAGLFSSAVLANSDLLGSTLNNAGKVIHTVGSRRTIASLAIGVFHGGDPTNSFSGGAPIGVYGPKTNEAYPFSATDTPQGYAYINQTALWTIIKGVTPTNPDPITTDNYYCVDYGISSRSGPTPYKIAPAGTQDPAFTTTCGATTCTCTAAPCELNVMDQPG
jgi:hypothetical protein